MFYDGLVEELEELGTPEEIVGKVARLVHLADRSFRGVSAEKSKLSAEKMEERRRKDRERKKKSYHAKKLKLQAESKANDVDSSLVSPREPAKTSAENCGELPLIYSNKEIKTSEEVVEKERKKGTEVKKERPEYAGGQTRRGTRITAGWQPSAGVMEWCRGQGVVGAAIAKIADEFVDYWVGVPGQRGAKLDWDATFRNWVRRKLEGFGGGGRGPQLAVANWRDAIR